MRGYLADASRPTGITKKGNQSMDPSTPYQISDAVTLFVQSSESIHNLWNFYMVASFAAAGFAATTSSLSRSTATLMSLAYCLFLAGHLSLLLHQIAIERAVANDIALWTITVPSEPFTRSVKLLSATRDSFMATWVIHLAIDACILGVIWQKAVSGKAGWSNSRAGA